MVGTKWSHKSTLDPIVKIYKILLRSLVGQEPDDDILLSRDIINDLRIGPNLDYTNFGNPTENEIQRIINVDWRDEGNPDDFQTNRNARRRKDHSIPNTYEVRITGFLTIETQGDGQFDHSSFNFETEPLIFPSNMVYTDISTNVSALKHQHMMVMNLILLRFEEGQNVTLTFPSEICKI